MKKNKRLLTIILCAFCVVILSTFIVGCATKEVPVSVSEAENSIRFCYTADGDLTYESVEVNAK